MIPSSRTMILFLFVVLYASIPITTIGGKAIAADKQTGCHPFSDSFSIIDPSRWQPIFLYSKVRGQATIDKSRLALTAPANTACEIQVYSLFLLEDDFDIELDYDVTPLAENSDCIFNGGLVLQTTDDTYSYKCYLSQKKETGLIYRTRFDRYGETKLEIAKLKKAPMTGVLRIVRKKGIVSLRSFQDKKWEELYRFQTPLTAPLRIRLKLETRTESNEDNHCDNQTILFDNFKINSCSAIRYE